MREHCTIQTERLFLREIRGDDTDFIVELRSDPEVYQYFKHPHRLTVEEHEKWYRKIYLQNDNILQWICEKDGVCIGVFAAVRVSDYEVEVSYIVSKEYQRKGYAEEALKSIILWVRREWKSERILAEIHKNNRASRAFIQSLGFCETVKKKDFIKYFLEKKETKMNDINAGQRIYELCDRIFPICRSLMGAGVRETLGVLDEYIADTGYHLNITEVPTGTHVYDWTIPKEWVIREAYIEDEAGKRIVDINDNNLHVLGYSVPVDEWMDLNEMGGHLYTQPDQPELIPYVTSYYKERFGFCMSENQKQNLKPGKYHMYVNSELKEGSLTYADLVIKGKLDKEVLITTYICHPSMANDICSGMSLLSELIRYVASLRERRYTYRFVLEPETIGSIAYISQHYDGLKGNVIAAFNLSCVGDDRTYSMVESPYADTYSDRILKNILSSRGRTEVYSYLERGSDERQYAAPGVDVPMVCFCRSKFGKFPEYHTSADNMSLVSPAGFQGSYDVMAEVIQVLEHNGKYRAEVFCEPQLGKRGMYPTTSRKGQYDDVRVFCDIVAYANGENDLITISEYLHKSAYELLVPVEKLKDNGLIEIVE